MKARTNTNTNTNTNTQREERQPISVTGYEIQRVIAGRDGTPIFNMTINGITVYGCKVMARKSDGEAFLAWPSAKGRDGNYHNVVYAKLSDADQEAIITEVYKMMDNAK